MHLITILTWVTLGPLIAMAVVLCGAFIAIPLADRRQARVLHWEPDGPRYPHTPRPGDPEPVTAPLPPHLASMALAVREQLEETDRIKRRIAGTMQRKD